MTNTDESGLTPPTATQPAVAPEPPADALTRRSFLTYLLGLAGALGLAGLLAPIMRYAYPVVTVMAAEKLKVAELATLEPLGEAVYFDYQDTPSALILLADGTPKAYSLICTHFGCIVKWRPERQGLLLPLPRGRLRPRRGRHLRPAAQGPDRTQGRERRDRHLRRRDGVSEWTRVPAPSAGSTAATACASPSSTN